MPESVDLSLPVDPSQVPVPESIDHSLSLSEVPVVQDVDIKKAQRLNLQEDTCKNNPYFVRRGTPQQAEYVVHSVNSSSPCHETILDRSDSAGLSMSLCERELALVDLQRQVRPLAHHLAAMHADVQRERGRSQEPRNVSFCVNDNETSTRRSCSAPLRQRMVSVSSSDVCNRSSPPSSVELRQRPSHAVGGSTASSMDGPMRVATQQPRGRAAPLVPLEEPVRYRLVAGARQPVYKNERAPTAASAKPKSESSVSDPILCCHCGVVVEQETNFAFVCEAPIPPHGYACAHVVCTDCVLEVPCADEHVCDCDHDVPCSDAPPGIDKPRSEPNGVDGALDPQAKLMVTCLTKLADRLDSYEKPASQPRSMVKTTQVAHFPKGNKDALGRLDLWLEEFDAVCDHLGGCTAQDRITHMLACWPLETDVGENMRLDQQSVEYRSARAEGHHEDCFQMLIARLCTYRTEPSEARKEAQSLWNGLYWPGHIQGYVTLFRRAVMACKRNHIPKQDFDVVLRFLELLPGHVAMYLEDEVRAPPDGYTFETAVEAARKYFALERTYTSTTSGDGGLKRNRATWHNDGRMLQAPLTAPPAKAKAAATPLTGDECSKCKGTGHKASECPNRVSEKDDSWKSKSEAARAKPCRKCKGIGHWDMHHKKTTQAQTTTQPTSTEDCLHFIRGKCVRGDQCRYRHDPKKAFREKPQNSSQAQSTAKKDCVFWKKGNCSRDKCTYVHDPKKRGTMTRATSAANESPTEQKPELIQLAVEPAVNRAQEISTQMHSDQPRFVTSRPTHIGIRRTNPAEDPYDFSRFKHMLPVVSPPIEGYCMSSFLRLINLPDFVNINVIWDGGAEGTSISDNCLSRIMRYQADLPAHKCPIRNQCRMNPSQYFYGFVGGKNEGIEVDILSDLYLCTTDGVELPCLSCRMVPGQSDDLLVCARDLDMLGWDRHTDPQFFLLQNFGIAVPRHVKDPFVLHQLSQFRSVCTTTPEKDLLCQLTVRRTMQVAPYTMDIVEVFGKPGSQGWFRTTGDLDLLGPEGPIELDIEDGSAQILVRNTTSDPIVLEVDSLIGSISVYDEEESILVQSLDQVSKEEEVRIEQCASRSSRSLTDKPTRVLRRWTLLAMSLLFGLLAVNHDELLTLPLPTSSVGVRLSAVNNEPIEEPVNQKLWSDLGCSEYKDALGEAFNAQRESRYSHLTDAGWEKLRTLVLSFSDCFVIDNVEPSTVSHYEFDIELVPGHKPWRHQLPKLSPAEVRKEQLHLAKAEKAGHVRVPTDEQRSENCVRTHVVFKKDDEDGRWICDFRPLNRATVKRPTPLGDCFSKVRNVASRRWKSALDAMAGFNQVSASERARRLMQIITTKGLRQWTVLPFGVTNGPPYFQEFMLGLFGGSSCQLPSLLGDAMVEFEAILEIFVDDVQLGTCDLSQIANESLSPEHGFDQHLAALEVLLTRTRIANLRYKLTKCYLCQFEVETLGMIAGCGVVRAAPSKTEAVRVWPRPTRIEDVERFLASMTFIRQHLSPQYSTVAKPLRDLLKPLHEKRASGQKCVKSRYLPKPRDHGDAWAEFWSEEAEDAFLRLKNMTVHAVELSTPDFVGAHDGGNKFHLWADACKFGVGAGLFQGAPTNAGKLLATYYDVMGVQPWASKAEIDRAHQLHRRDEKRVGCSTSSLRFTLDEIEKAYQVLSHTSARADYDASIGLAEKRRARIDLKPLGFFSKSLTKAQINWTVWEKELSAVVMAVDFFRPIVAGTRLVIHSDHLNNTVLAHVLADPSKILRLLMKLESVVTPEWIYEPGKGQFGDGLSRNPPDRDVVREEQEAPKQLTLSEVFEVVTRARLDGSLIDDADSLCFSRRVVGSVDPIQSIITPCDDECVFKSLSAESMFAVHATHHVIPCVVSQRPSSLAPGQALFVPSFAEDASTLDGYEEYRVEGPEIVFQVEAVLQPAILTPLGGRRWLEAYQTPPWSQQYRKRFRLTLYDAVIAVLRALAMAPMQAILAHGEGALVALALLTPSVRTAAMDERHLQANDREVLLASLRNVTHFMLFSPHGFPIRSFTTLLRDVVPELSSVCTDLEVVVHVIIPLRDASGRVARECAMSINNCVEEVVEFHGPAYLRLPKSPFKSQQLGPIADVVKELTPAEGQPTQFVEISTDPHRCLSAFMLQLGFTTRFYEAHAANISGPLPADVITRA